MDVIVDQIDKDLDSSEKIVSFLGETIPRGVGLSNSKGLLDATPYIFRDDKFPRFKERTDWFIKEAKKQNYVYENSGMLDQSIIPIIERINQNPDITTIASCSGHSHPDSHPYVYLIFRTPEAKQHYLLKIKEKIIQQRLDKEPYLFYILEWPDIPNTVSVALDHNFDHPSIYMEEGQPAAFPELSKEQAMKYWQIWEDIFSKP